MIQNKLRYSWERRFSFAPRTDNLKPYRRRASRGELLLLLDLTHRVTFCRLHTLRGAIYKTDR